MKIEIELSEDNEGTYAPYWQIIDPKILKDVIRGIKKHGNNIKYEELARYIAFSTTGIFFSRKAADNLLKAKHYNYSDHAVVWCNSGHASFEYTQAIKNSISIQNKKNTLTFEQAINEFRKNDQHKFKIIVNEVNWVGNLRYLIHHLTLDILLNKEFEICNLSEEKVKNENTTSESQTVCKVPMEEKH